MGKGLTNLNTEVGFLLLLPAVKGWSPLTSQPLFFFQYSACQHTLKHLLNPLIFTSALTHSTPEPTPLMEKQKVQLMPALTHSVLLSGPAELT